MDSPPVPERVHYLPASTKAIVWLGSGLALAVSCWVMALPWIPSSEPVGIPFALFVGGVGVACCAFCIYSTHRSRVEIYPDRVREVGVFRSRELLSVEIYGFWTSLDEGALVLQPLSSSHKPISIPLSRDRERELLDWARSRFPDLSLQVATRILDQVKRDESLGADPAERTQRYAAAGKVASRSLVASALLFVWAVVFPVPQPLVAWLLVAVPPLGILCAWKYRGALAVMQSGPYVRPSIQAALVLSTGVLALRARLDWQILQWEHFWPPFFGFLIFGALTLAAVAPELRRSIKAACWSLLFCGLYAFGAVLAINVLLDRNPGAANPVHIVSKEALDSGDCHFGLSGWIRDRVAATEGTCRSHAVGDETTVIVRHGALGIPWFYVE